jgi:hypothetical protein
MNMGTKSVNEIMQKYGKELESKNKDSLMQNSFEQGDISQEFVQFKSDMMPELSRYERMCNNFGRIKGLKLSKKDDASIQTQLDLAHLDVSPSQVVGLSFLIGFFTFIVGILISAAVYFVSLNYVVGGYFPTLLFSLFVVASGFLFYYFYKMPARLANQWRLKAGSQMVPCILYVVVYMKHTSNLERAIRFASQHLDPPLAIDMKKVFWDVEIGKHSTIKESLDAYLESWRAASPEFVESFNLIESSLFEPSEARRVQILERSLSVILEGVYDNMLKYSREVRSPLTNIYMLGIVLPTLGLALIPLASALLGGAIQWYHIFVLFNILIPFFVFYMTNNVIMKRPVGYGESSILELNPLYPKYKSKKPYYIALAICLPLFILGFVPYFFQFTPLPDWLGLKSDYTFQEMGIPLGDAKVFDYIKGAGPMGIFSLIFSLFIPLSIILFFSISYKMKTREIIKYRDYSKVLEGEFNNSLFQLGNRIGDGTPAELAFGKVAENVRGQVTENFFRIVNSNIQSNGMGLEKAIFDTKRGAIINYPSSLISTSMHILVESVKKGLAVAAASLMSISDYVRNINKINDRLRDLLAEVISDMRANMTFLAPMLAGIVVGLGNMITVILSKLGSMINSETGTAGLPAMALQINKLFPVDAMIPPYFLQICIGVYIIEIVFILTKTLVAVDSGQDSLKETYDIGRNLLSAGLLYLVIALLATTILSVIAMMALYGIAS